MNFNNKLSEFFRNNHNFQIINRVMIENNHIIILFKNFLLNLYFH